MEAAWKTSDCGFRTECIQSTDRWAVRTLSLPTAAKRSHTLPLGNVWTGPWSIEELYEKVTRLRRRADSGESCQRNLAGFLFVRQCDCYRIYTPLQEIFDGRRRE